MQNGIYNVKRKGRKKASVKERAEYNVSLSTLIHFSIRFKDTMNNSCTTTDVVDC